MLILLLAETFIDDSKPSEYLPRSRKRLQSNKCGHGNARLVKAGSQSLLTERQRDLQAGMATCSEQTGAKTAHKKSLRCFEQL